MLKKKLTAFALATALMISAFPATVFAEAPVEGTGEEAVAEASVQQDESVAPTDSDKTKESEKEVSADAEAVKDDELEEEDLDEEDFIVVDPLDYDAFKMAKTKKSDSVNNHTFWNLFMFDGDYSRGTETYVYGGQTYTFPNIDGLYYSVQEHNQKGDTCTVQLMLKNTHSEVAYDGVSPDTGTGQTALYYQPDVTVEGKRAKLEAYVDYVTKKLSSKSAHVDAWVVGNEVNMPVQWNWSNTTDANTIVDRYSAFYNMVYDKVRATGSVARVCVCLDHSWTNNDQGRGVAGRDFLDRFHVNCSGREWSLAYHPYPALLENPEIWNDEQILLNPPYALKNPVQSQEADFIDGSNYNNMTSYVSSHFGDSHRVIVTEFGINENKGEDVQAAALAMTYYATSTDPITDAVIYQGHGPYALGGKAQQVWSLVDSSNPSDQETVAQMVLPTIGKTSNNSYSAWKELIPTMATATADVGQIRAFCTRIYTVGLDRQPDEAGLEYWTNEIVSGRKSSAEVAAGFFDSTEMKNRNLTNPQFLEVLYEVMMGRKADAEGLAYWEKRLNSGVGRMGVYRGFAESKEFATICAGYGVSPGTYTPHLYRDKNPGLTMLFYREYTIALGRPAEEEGLEYWTEQVLTGKQSLDACVTNGFFNSPEFLGKQMSNDQFLEVAYPTFFDRAPDAAGKADWNNRMANGLSRLGVVEGFCGSQEFNNLKHEFGVDNISVPATSNADPGWTP